MTDNCEKLNTGINCGNNIVINFPQKPEIPQVLLEAIIKEKGVDEALAQINSLNDKYINQNI